MPILKATSRFIGLGVISTDVYVGGGGKGIDGRDLEYYVNTVSRPKTQAESVTN